MAKENWAQRYSNEEKTIFQKGDWSLTEDGEKVWSLYYKDNCVSPVLEYNKFKLFDGGFLLYVKEENANSFALFASEEDKPLYKSSGKNCSFEIDRDLIIFSNETGHMTAFETCFLTKLSLDDENQLSFVI
ncbi:MAG: hypothetical protein IJ415_01610 [Clostridia bacterium]|nr:hypothetical protein [Clostridia bacterium]